MASKYNTAIYAVIECLAKLNIIDESIRKDFYSWVKLEESKRHEAAEEAQVKELLTNLGREKIEKILAKSDSVTNVDHNK